MVIREARRIDQSLRDYPLYTVPEAAIYLGMPQRTLYRWVSDDPLWSPGADAETKLLSFNDVAQFHFIEFIRKHAGISMPKAREILRNARLETNARYPLLDRNVKVLFHHVLLDRPRRGRKPRCVVDLSQHRQIVMQHVVDLFATRVRRDNSGELVQIYPWRLYKAGSIDRPVTLDPDIMSGRLVVTGTRVPARVLWLRKQSGETVRDLAREYRLSRRTVALTLKHLGLPQAA